MVVIVNKFYTGTGSKETPQEIQDIMFKLAEKLAKQNVILRTGEAYGAEWAFKKGCHSVLGQKDIYLGYQETKESIAMAKELYPEEWMQFSIHERQQHSIKVFQVLGRSLSNPSTCLILWTEDGCITFNQKTQNTGHSATAIAIANRFNIPVYNLKREDHLNQWVKWLEK